MFDIGWTELLVIGVVALLVIGPKDLPIMLKTVGAWVRKARAMAREFQAGVDDLIREAELDQLKKDAEKVAQFDVDAELKKTIDPTGSLEKAFEAEPPQPAPALEGDTFTPPEREPEPAPAPADASAKPDVKTGTGD